MKQIMADVYVEDQLSLPPSDRGCNPSFVTTSEGIVMIDTPMWPSDAVRWRDDLAKRGEVRYIINTHHHPDHITGNYFFPGTVVSHEEVKEMFHAPITGKASAQPVDETAEPPLGLREHILDEIKERDPGGFSLMEHYFLKVPTITFSEQLNLYMGQHIFELIHLPGHTSGHIGVYVRPEKVFFAGDNFTNGVQPLLSHSLPLEWISSLKRIEEMDIDIVVPGHGEVCGKSEIQQFRLFIQKCIEIVSEAIKQGMSKDQAANEISLEELYPAIHPGPEQERMNILRLYEMLSK
ncbi:MAG TPA: MBL fold metallo-hydrolase [Desulfatiglandales bacterium]|nr:MBL fold metallo-hydrolase [Desulfatiglandales bacterium]